MKNGDNFKWKNKVAKGKFLKKFLKSHKKLNLEIIMTIKLQ